MPIASHPSTRKQYPTSRDHMKPRPLLCQGYLFQSLQGIMSQVTPVHGPQAASLGCLHQCLSCHTLHFHLLIRKKKATIELPPHICFPYPSLLPSPPVAWIIPTQCLFPPTPTTYPSALSLPAAPSHLPHSLLQTAQGNQRWRCSWQTSGNPSP